MPKKNPKPDVNRCALADEDSAVCTPVENKHLPLCKTHLKYLERTVARMGQTNHRWESMTEKGGDAFVFNRQSGAVYALNMTGVFIVKKIISGQDPVSIIEDLRQTFAVDSRIEILKDLFGFLREVQKTDLIAPADDHGSK